jgi:hypothetical protein
MIATKSPGTKKSGDENSALKKFEDAGDDAMLDCFMIILNERGSD